MRIIPLLIAGCLVTTACVRTSTDPVTGRVDVDVESPTKQGEDWDAKLTSAANPSIQGTAEARVASGETTVSISVTGLPTTSGLTWHVHESGCGTKGVARTTRSLGNIRWTQGFENYQGYRKYESWEQGMEDWYKLITELYIGAWNLRTVDKIIPVYAPWGDNNNPPSYIRSVKTMVDVWRAW